GRARKVVVGGLSGRAEAPITSRANTPAVVPAGYLPGAIWCQTWAVPPFSAYRPRLFRRRETSSHEPPFVIPYECSHCRNQDHHQRRRRCYTIPLLTHHPAGCAGC